MIARPAARRKWPKTLQDAEKRRSEGFTARAGTPANGGNGAGAAI
jgi:hypothetical protein